LRRFATKVIFKSLKEGEQMSALRNWIVTNLKNLLPSAPMTIWSDTNGSQFQQLTGLTQEELMTKWYGPKDSSGNRSGTGTDPTFTTCTSFLPRFASTVASAGGLAGKQLRPFKLNTENGWVANADGASPEAGDFFLLGTAVHLEHVGVILEVDGSNWSMVAGGAGGKRFQHDGVKRTALEPMPGAVMGWLDVDTYFSGWVSPSADIYNDDDDDDPYK